jgi:hypothetical protein
MTRDRAASVLFRLSDSAKPASTWGLVTQAGGFGADGVETRVLEQRGVDRSEVRGLVAVLMADLEDFSARGLRTPGGAWWLDVHHVPVRRLLTQVVRKLLQLNSYAPYAPYAQSPGPIRPAAGEGLIGTRSGSAREYRYYTATWSGLAYVLGAPTRRNPAYAPDLVRRERSGALPLGGGGAVVPVGGPAARRTWWACRGPRGTRRPCCRCLGNCTAAVTGSSRWTWRPTRPSGSRRRMSRWCPCRRRCCG